MAYGLILCAGIPHSNCGTNKNDEGFDSGNYITSGLSVYGV